MILFPSKYLGDMERFHNFAECQQRNHSEDRQNDKSLKICKDEKDDFSVAIVNTCKSILWTNNSDAKSKLCRS